MGNPNGDKLPEWIKAAPYDKTPPVMIIDLESKTVKATNDARYKFLDKMYGN
ncbi:MAG: para-nitrobenzyl esterase [Spirosomataceae bacterium]|jgi:para-nitrobenzyl esterase